MGVRFSGLIGGAGGGGATLVFPYTLPGPTPGGEFIGNFGAGGSATISIVNQSTSGYAEFFAENDAASDYSFGVGGTAIGGNFQNAAYQVAASTLGDVINAHLGTGDWIWQTGATNVEVKRLTDTGKLAVGIGTGVPTYGFQLTPTSGLTANATVWIQDAALTGITKVLMQAGAGQLANEILELNSTLTVAFSQGTVATSFLRLRTLNNSGIAASAAIRLQTSSDGGNNNAMVSLVGRAIATGSTGTDFFVQTRNAANAFVEPLIVRSTGLIGFGGIVAGNPALKPVATVLQSRLGDDSGFAPLQGALRTDVNAATGLGAGVLAATTNASIVISDASGQLYRVPCII